MIQRLDYKCLHACKGERRKKYTSPPSCMRTLYIKKVSLLTLFLLFYNAIFDKYPYFKINLLVQLPRGRGIFKTWTTRFNYKNDRTFEKPSGYFKFHLLSLLLRGRCIFNTWNTRVNFENNEIFKNSSKYLLFQFFNHLPRGRCILNIETSMITFMADETYETPSEYLQFQFSYQLLRQMYF